FDTNSGRFTVQNQEFRRTQLGEFATHMLGVRRRNLPKLVRRRRRHAALPSGLQGGKTRQQRLRNGMGGTAHPNGGMPPADGGRNARRARQNKRKRPWPERIGQRTRGGRYAICPP